MNNKLMAELLFPNVTTTLEDLEKRFPRRKEGTVVIWGSGYWYGY